jgi:hypothetical protein
MPQGDDLLTDHQEGLVRKHLAAGNVAWRRAATESFE